MSRIRVLVVDDDLASRVLAAVLLERAGYAPIAVASVDRALERLDAGEADAVVTDLDMPVRGGLELLESLRERGAAVPAVVVSGSDDDAAVGRARELGAVAVLRKPYAPDGFDAALAAALVA